MNHRPRGGNETKMRRIIVFEIDLETIINRTEADDRVRWYEPSDRATLVAHDIKERTLDWFLETGGRITVFESDSQVIGWNFYSFADEPHYGWMLLRMPIDAVYASTSYVLPDHRGNQTTARLKGFAARYFVGEGYKRMLSTVNFRNIASMKAHTFVGARPAADLRIIRLHRCRAVIRRGRLKFGCWNDSHPYELHLDDG